METPAVNTTTITQVSKPFFTSSELSYLHSISIPENKKLAYNQRKHQVFQFLYQIVKAMKFPLKVLNTAMNYYQRFYLFNTFQDKTGEKNEVETVEDMEHDAFVVAISCLFLASKNEDCIKKLKDIQMVAHKVKDIDDKDKNGLALNGNNLDNERKAVMALEFKLLQVLKFDFLNGNSLTIESLDKLVVQFCKKLGMTYRISMFAWLLSFDLISTPLPLMVPQHCIALAIIIITLNLKPKEVNTKFEPVEDEIMNLAQILDSIDSYEQFRCPEPLVNEAIIYILDYYIHQMSYSILNEYVPAVDKDTGKEQIFKFMDLKSRFNDLTKLNQKWSRLTMEKDEYLKIWKYDPKGTARFMLGNKRRRFNRELNGV